VSLSDEERAITARRWVLTQLALIRMPEAGLPAANAGSAAFRQQMSRAGSGWDKSGSEPDWNLYWEADRLAANAYATAMIAVRDAEHDRLMLFETASNEELLGMARENLRNYRHALPRWTATECLLLAIDGHIQLASGVAQYYDHFRDEPEERQTEILENLVTAALKPKAELKPKEGDDYDRAVIFDFAADLIARLKDGGRYNDNVHKPFDDRLAASRRPKGRPGKKPTARDPLFLSLVQEVMRRFDIPAERNDRERRDGALKLVGITIDEVFLPLRGGLRHGTGLESAASKIWERHRKAQKG
jgi:hypothetical protein